MRGGVASSRGGGYPFRVRVPGDGDEDAEAVG